MGLFIALAIGWVAGWFWTTVRRDDRAGLINIVAGSSGALLASYLLSALVNGPPLTGEAFDSSSCLVALLGAIETLATANLIRSSLARHAKWPQVRR